MTFHKCAQTAKETPKVDSPKPTRASKSHSTPQRIMYTMQELMALKTSSLDRDIPEAIISCIDSCWSKYSLKPIHRTFTSFYSVEALLLKSNVMFDTCDGTFFLYSLPLLAPQNGSVVCTIREKCNATPASDTTKAKYPSGPWMVCPLKASSY